MVKVREEPLLSVNKGDDFLKALQRIEQQAGLSPNNGFQKAYHLLLKPSSRCDEKTLWSDIAHGLKIAQILAELHLDEGSLIAGLLYRSVRKEHCSLQSIKKSCGSEVANLIQGVLNMAAITQSQEKSGLFLAHNQEENLRKMLVSMIDDVRVALIKIAERITMLRVNKTDQHKAQRIAREVITIYAPLAHRLGVGQLKWELEDLSFRYLHPQPYREIAKQIAEKRLDRDRYIQNIKSILTDLLESCCIQSFVIEGRAKHLYSIWRKMQRKKIAFKDIYDVRAVRILLSSIEDCYAVLSLIQARWPFLNHEFDDYIVNPKLNGYQSLHTAIIGPENKIVEIQLRTFAMHEAAELGICAHWRYKGTDLDLRNQNYEQKIDWMRQVLAWKNELKLSVNANEPENSEQKLVVHTDSPVLTVKNERVYVFTPNNHVIDLPHKATPLDFAYYLHTEIGHRCRGAKVNGRIVALQTQLHTGERVEILTVKIGQPSRDWLNPQLGYIHTSRARSKINAWFKQQARHERIEAGKNMLEKELARLNLSIPNRWQFSAKLSTENMEDLYAGLGANVIRLSTVIARIQEFNQESKSRIVFKPLLPKSLHESSQSAITVLGVDNLKIQLANCCHPLPEEAILGFITQGRGISIHRQDCHNLQQLQKNYPKRLIEVQWKKSSKKYYQLGLQIKGWNRPEFVQEVSQLFAQTKIAINQVNENILKKQQCIELRLHFEITTVSELEALIQQLQKINGVLEVKRIG